MSSQVKQLKTRAYMTRSTDDIKSGIALCRNFLAGKFRFVTFSFDLGYDGGDDCV